MQLTYQAETNSLRLTQGKGEARSERLQSVDLDGYVDVGQGGRLLGVEALTGGRHDISLMLSSWLADPDTAEWVDLDVDSVYITLSLPDDPELAAPGVSLGEVLTAPARLRAELDQSARLVALSIPRRGAGYEISYPGGNR
ncbi:MAG TPA: hypothetical protein VKU87_03140 [Thermomicrobiaceae bacterium]|nr:hypothetical protein [Thermomicrobiaceae bacterium]